MAIDFERMKKVLIDYAPDSEDEILEGIEKLKTMSDEEIDKIDTFIYDYVRDVVAGDSGDDVVNYNWEEVTSEYYAKLNPLPDDVDQEKWNDEEWMEYNDKRDKWRRFSIPAELFDEIWDEAYERLDDNITDEIRRTGTSEAAENWDLPVEIIYYLCPNALPYLG